MDDESKKGLQYSDDPIIKDINREVIWGIYYSWIGRFDRYNAESQYDQIDAIPNNLLQGSKIMYFNYMKCLNEKDLINHYLERIQDNIDRYVGMTSLYFTINYVEKKVVFSPPLQHKNFLGMGFLLKLTDKEKDAIIDRINSKKVGLPTNMNGVPTFYQTSPEVMINRYVKKRDKNGKYIKDKKGNFIEEYKNVMKEWGCYFISIVYGVSQLIGYNFTAEEIKILANEAYAKGYIGEDMEVGAQQEELVKYIFKRIGFDVSVDAVEVKVRAEDKNEARVNMEVESKGRHDKTIQEANEAAYEAIDQCLKKIIGLKNKNIALNDDNIKLKKDNDLLKNDKVKFNGNGLTLEKGIKEVMQYDKLLLKSIEKILIGIEPLIRELSESKKNVGVLKDHIENFKGNSVSLLYDMRQFGENNDLIMDSIKSFYKKNELSVISLPIIDVEKFKNSRRSLIKNIEETVKYNSEFLDYIDKFILDDATLMRIVEKLKNNNKSLQENIKNIIVDESKKNRTNELVSRIEKFIENSKSLMSIEKEIIKNVESIKNNNEKINQNIQLIGRYEKSIDKLQKGAADNEELYKKFLPTAENISSTFVIKKVHSTIIGDHFVLANKDGETKYDPTPGLEKNPNYVYKLYEIRTFKVIINKKI